MTRALARKYRPRRFAEVVGQEPITEALRTAFRKGRIGQAYLFHGPRGTGKTTCARILARVLNCEHPTPEGEPCLECRSCRSFDEGRSVNIYELDAASNSSVEDIRTLIEQVHYPPSSGKYKVYIIDEVHMLSQSAFNAFLKTLEEPPAHVVFILATTEKHRILPTILSRCQVFDFRRVAVPRIVERLRQVLDSEGVEAADEALYAIAEQADGIMRDALTLADRIISGADGPLTADVVYRLLGVPPVDTFFALWEAILQRDVEAAFDHIHRLVQQGYDEALIFRGLRWHIRHLLLAARPRTQELLQLAPSVVERLIRQAQDVDPLYLVNALHTTGEMEGRLARSLVPRLHLETAVLKLIYLQDIVAPVPAKRSSVEPPPGRSPGGFSAQKRSDKGATPSAPRTESRASPSGGAAPAEGPPAPKAAPSTSAPSSQGLDPTSWRDLWAGFVATLEGGFQKAAQAAEVTSADDQAVQVVVDPGWGGRLEEKLKRYLLRTARKSYEWRVVERKRATAREKLDELAERHPVAKRLRDGLGLSPV